MQENIVVSGDSITGTLKYYSNKNKALVKDWGAGNFLAVKVSDLDSNTTKVLIGLQPSAGTGLVEMDADLNGVFKISDHKNQKLKVVQVDATGKQNNVQYFSLKNLTCLSE